MPDPAKSLLRREVAARRQAMGEVLRGVASSAAREALMPVLRGRAVGLFWPLADEIDTRPLLPLLVAQGRRPLLPRMTGFRRPLAFHAWDQRVPLAQGRFGVMEPPPDQPEVPPDTVVTPLLAFDRHGQRLGYGAGFYDRTFADLAERGCRPLRIGLAFACQEVDAVPSGPHDVPLDLVVTESATIYPATATSPPA